MEEPAEKASKPKARSGVIEEWIGDEVFIYDHSNGDDVHHLNGGAAVIWLLCDGTRDLNRIAKEISQAFDLPRSKVLSQVEKTVIQFHQLALLTN